MPPNYRKAEVPGRSCKTCEYYNGVMSSCRRYNVHVKPDMTCRMWGSKEMKAAYAKGFMDKCAEHGVDPAALIKLSQDATPPTPTPKKKGILRGVFDKITGGGEPIPAATNSVPSSTGIPRYLDVYK